MVKRAPFRVCIIGIDELQVIHGVNAKALSEALWNGEDVGEPTGGACPVDAEVGTGNDLIVGEVPNLGELSVDIVTVVGAAALVVELESCAV